MHGALPSSESKEPARIRLMFAGISPRYDLLNHLLSANMDRGWRRAAAEELPAGGVEQVLDLCGGTGDLGLDLLRLGRAGSVVCCDFSHEMLALAKEKIRKRGVDDRCFVLEADGLRLPFPAASFDAVTVGFGVRSFVDLDRGFREMHRVLRPGGRMVVLEFSRPAGPVVARMYRFYLKRILPGLGDAISGGNGAYRYLSRTIAEFPDPPTLAGRIREAGFAACSWTSKTAGIVAIHTGHKAF